MTDDQNRRSDPDRSEALLAAWLAAEVPATASDPEDGEDPRVNIFDPETGKSRMLSRQCATCVFRPGNPMHLAPGGLADLVSGARRGQSYVVCHDTLPVHGPQARPAICRGFADRYDTTALRLIGVLWGFVEVDPPDPSPTSPATLRDQPPAGTDGEQTR